MRLTRPSYSCRCDAGVLELRHRSVADEVGVLDERRGVGSAACVLAYDLASVALEPSPIAKLVQLEVAAIEEVHLTVVDEPVRNDGNAVEGQRAEAAVEIHVVDVGASRRAGVEICPATVVGAEDDIGRRAGVLVDHVDCLLHLLGVDCADLGLGDRLKILLVGAAQSVQIAGAEHRFKPGDLVVFGALHGECDVVAFGDCAAGAGDGDLFCGAVDFGDAHSLERLDGVAVRVVAVKHHAFDEPLDAVDDKDVVGRAVVGRLAEVAAAVAVQHSAEVELGRLQQPLHLGVEQVDERAGAGLRRPNRLVGQLDRAVKVFEFQLEALVVIGRRSRQSARLGACSDAAVDAVRHQLDDLLAPDVGRSLLDHRVEGIDPDVELVCDDPEVYRLEGLFRCFQCYHN